MKDKIGYKSSDKCLGKKFLRFITMSDKSADVQKSKIKKPLIVSIAFYCLNNTHAKFQIKRFV